MVYEPKQENTKKALLKKLRDIALKDKDDRNALPAITKLLDYIEEKETRKQPDRLKVIKEVVDEEKLQEAIGWSPHQPKIHQAQVDILNCKAKDIVICAGRQGGKTFLCAYMALKALLERNKKICLIAPTYDLTGRVFDYLTTWIQKSFKKEMRVTLKPVPFIKTAWGSFLDCRSAEKPDQILGKGYDLIIIDECSRISQSVHDIYIVPASGKQVGQYFYISTPHGKNWFYRRWLMAKEEGGAFHFKSEDNPYFEKAKLDEARGKLPERIYNQEYNAIFMDDAAGVFRGVRDCVNGELEEYNPVHLYIAGIDLGRYNDFTVITVIDRMTNRVVYFDRIKEIDWTLQKTKIKAVLEKYGNCSAWMDSTSITVGDAYVQELSDEGFNVLGYKISTSTAKRQLVERLVTKIEQKTVFYPDIPELIDELEAYSYEITDSGIIKYGAPEGYHDDCVMSLALAVWELDNELLQELKESQTEVYTPNQNF